MSWYLANEKELVGQFASGGGFADLRKAAQSYPALKDFFDEGATKNVLLISIQLGDLAKKEGGDVATTAKGLADMMRKWQLVSITQGFGGRQ